MTTTTNKLGLALSGGGFRASLYHLGLVRFLRDAGILRHVSHIIRHDRDHKFIERVNVVTEYLATDYSILASKLLTPTVTR